MLTADLFLVATILVVTSYSIELILNEGSKNLNDEFDFTYPGIFLHIGMQLFANDCTGRLFEIRHKMIDSSKFLGLLKVLY